MATLKLFELEGSSLFYTLIKKEIRHKMNSGQKYKTSDKLNIRKI